MEYFPAPIKMDRMLVYETGCDGFFTCAGGVIVKMSEKDATQIHEGGVEYLNRLSDTAINGRNIGKWHLVDKSERISLYYSGRRKNEYKTRLSNALKKDDCYRTNGLIILEIA